MRWPARDQLEDGRTEGVDVAARVDRRVAASLLGRHVGRRADDVAASSHPDVVRRGDSEVHQLRCDVEVLRALVARHAEEDVARLDVAMNDASVVGGLESLRDEDAQLDALWKRERRAALTCSEMPPRGRSPRGSGFGAHRPRDRGAPLLAARHRPRRSRSSRQRAHRFPHPAHGTRRLRRRDRPRARCGSVPPACALSSPKSQQRSR